MTHRASLSIWRILAAIPAACALVLPVHAHEVHETVTQAPATVVQLRYADDEPFARERYELFADGSTTPTLTGRTDAQGRIVFLGDGVTRWRLRAFSADGHGVDVPLEVAAAGAPAASGPAPSDAGRAWRLVLGGLAIAAVAGGVMTWLQRSRSAPSSR